MAEGLSAEIFAACSAGAVLTGWAIYLGADAFLIGVVAALPQMAQLLQIPAAWTTSRLGSRRAAIVLVAAQRQVALPLAALPWLPLSAGAGRAILVVVTALAAILSVLGNNAWVSWMGDLVPARIRGRYFGRRTALCTAGGAAAAAAAGLLLDGAHRHGLAGEGLALLQVLASASGLLSAMLMARQQEGCRQRTDRDGGFSFRQALEPIRDRSVRGFFGYLLAWNFAIGIANSFFVLFMLRDLRLAFTVVALQSMGSAVVRMAIASSWGSLIDRVGARPVLVVCSFGISLIPLIWLFPTPTCLWPLAVDSLLTGVLWSGHNLAAFALPLAVAPRASRPWYLALFATAGGVSSVLAAAVAGLLVRVLPEHVTVVGNAFGRLQQLFVLSAALRLLASMVALRMQHASIHDVLIVARSARLAMPGWLLGRPWRATSTSDTGRG